MQSEREREREGGVVYDDDDGDDDDDDYKEISFVSNLVYNQKKKYTGSSIFGSLVNRI